MPQQRTVPLQERLIDGYLRMWAKFAYSKHPPFAIGITGSVGKTTTTEKIASLLEADEITPLFAALSVTRRNMNNNRGLPMTMLGYSSWPKSGADLLRRLVAAPARALGMRHSSSRRAAVLEFAAGPQGDLPRLATVLPLDIGIVTAIGPTHLDTFGTIEGVAAAKGALIEAVKPTGLAILGRDNPFLESMIARSKARTIVLDGRGRVLATNIAMAVAEYLNIPTAAAERALAASTDPPGRLEVIAASSLTIINDAFNANPLSMTLGLDHLNEQAAGRRRVAILGQMAELGEETRRYHAEVARLAHERSDLVVGVGDLAAHYRPSRLYRTVDECAASVHTLLRKGDCILIKGSHSVHLERLLPILRRLAREMSDTPVNGRGAAPSSC